MQTKSRGAEIFPQIPLYRFSAFWLRSKCSICSYQLNIWYVAHWATTILNWFLELGEESGACSAFATGRPGIAVPPGPAHSSLYNRSWPPELRSTAPAVGYRACRGAATVHRRPGHYFEWVSGGCRAAEGQARPFITGAGSWYIGPGTSFLSLYSLRRYIY